ncbi:TPA: site-specific integrase [Pseudomonas aeruginosa]|nr:site-specific integrase [Pseudomonas aeruginosa]HBO9624938.1 site-specific integrase [Pseudomonas aeruginosa]HBO9837863.1 site-specific integrase [Pseudomonas aeruginosa]
MKAKLTLSLLNSLETTGTTYEVHDTTVTGLFVRVTASGHKAYVVTWGRAKKRTLGRVGVLTLDQARKEALQYLAEAREYGEPLAVTQGRRSANSLTLRRFIDDHYSPWMATNLKSADKTLNLLNVGFASIMSKRLNEISQRDLESQRMAWLKAGNTDSTANRKMASMRGALSRAIEWGFLTEHPMTRLKQLKTDRKGRIRYLLPDEEARLRQALDDRQETIRAERDSANKWREERHKSLLPDLREVAFPDHLKPLILVSLNTGMRRGEVFNLTWADIDLKNKLITVEGDTSKSGQTRHIPMNKETVATIEEWRKQYPRNSGYVFPGKDGNRLDNVKKSWDGVLKLAGIEGFRWHDLRHTFASKLVMAGVPLNTVRDLLGHSDLAMTLRYAHLAPDSKASAVNLL